MINIKENAFSDLLSLEKLTENEIITPFPVVKKMVELLPEDIFQNPNNKFIDVSTKSGIYLKYIFFNLLENLPNIKIVKDNNDLDFLIDQNYDFNNKEDKKKFILKYMIYGIATSELSFLTSKRTLYENTIENEDTQKEGKILSKPIFDNKDGNIIYKKMKDDKYWFLEEKKEKILKELSKNIKFKKDKKMKFNVIIGNPPYQKSTSLDKNNAKSIYHYFIENAINLNPNYISFITPSRWMYSKEFSNFRKSFVLKGKIKFLYDFRNEKICFPSVTGIDGGVNYFLWDKNYQGNCKYYECFNDYQEYIEKDFKNYVNNFDVCIRGVMEEKILSKIIKKENNFLEAFSENNIFGISKQSPFGLKTNFMNYKSIKDKDYNIALYGNKTTHKKNSNLIGYTKKDFIKKNQKIVSFYKVIVPLVRGLENKKPFKVLGDTTITEKNSVCTQTYIVLKSFEKKIEAYNFEKYVKTKFFRYLVSLIKNGKHGEYYVYKFVPELDYSNEWTDEELYKKYNLTEEEINYIENNIKEME